ncbi:MAG: glycosyltransferase family 2 protein [Actinomycetota bacterium]|nr:glycosyltransferase family 2 protein [Actinomycetota bacterium]
MSEGDIAPGLSIVVPVYRGMPTLEELHRRLDAVARAGGSPFEIIFVDDASPDDSWRVICALAATHANVHGIKLLRNFGQHAALLAGLRSAHYSVVVTLDDDLQNPPEEIPRLLGALTDEVDVVYGVPTSVQQNLSRRLAGRLARWSVRMAVGDNSVHTFTSFRAFRTELRGAFDGPVGPSVNLDVLLSWGTTRFTAIEVVQAPRRTGDSNYGVGHLVRFALDVFTGFSTFPLRIASLLGLATAAFGVVLLAWVLGRLVLTGESTTGFPFLASALSIFSGVQLLLLGIIGEYIGRMHFRVMRKPSYAIRSTTDRN